MRTLKFRAWDKHLLKMHQNVEHTYDWDPFGIYGWTNAIHACFWSILDEKDRFEVMQFSWYLDKLGKEIYEGDIVKYIDLDWVECTWYIYVSWIAFTVSWYNFNSYCEVIWNIHENSELLN